jgi:hypothetical protein
MTETNQTYQEWLEQAATAGIDWKNDPPPAAFQTEELCIADLEDAPEHLALIPPSQRTEDVCFAAVYYDDACLQYVPEALKQSVKAKKDAITEDQWLDELSIWTGNHYLKLPARLLTPAFIRRMVALNGDTIALVPQNLRTPELEQISRLDNVKKWERNLRAKKAPSLVQGGVTTLMKNALKP